MVKKHERNKLQKVVSLGSVFTNGLLMAATSYTIFMLAGTFLTGNINVNTIGLISFPVVSLSLIALGTLWCGIQASIRNAKLSFHSETEASQATASTNLASASAAMAVVGIFASQLTISIQLMSTVFILASISCLIAYISYADYQHIAA